MVKVNMNRPALLWFAERVNAVLLLTLMSWLVLAIQHQAFHTYRDFQVWLADASHLLALVMLVFSLHWHLGKGLQHVMDDYVQIRWQHRWLGISIKLMLAALTIAGIAALIHISRQ